jgi:hypothetical protein
MPFGPSLIVWILWKDFRPGIADFVLSLAASDALQKGQTGKFELILSMLPHKVSDEHQHSPECVSCRAESSSVFIHPD